MDVSIVIPTYNRCGLLEKTLESVAMQETKGVTFETIIADDGSTDATYELVEKYRGVISNLEYVKNEHDGYRVGYVRNNGVFHSKGAIIIFIDSGMIIDKQFVYQHFKAHVNERVAIIGNVYGMAATMTDDEFFRMISLDDLDATFSNVCSQKIYDDPRKACYEYFNYDTKKMRAPYGFFWTGNVSVKRKDFDAINGFDEEITGWGMEDVEFGYRLFCSGVKLELSMDAKAIHLPHDAAPTIYEPIYAEKDLKNKKYFYDKFQNIDTELYVAACRDLQYNIFLDNFLGKSNTRLDFSRLFLKEFFGDKSYFNTVIFGAHNGSIATYFPSATLVEYDSRFYNIIKNGKSNTDVYHLVGAYTPFKDGEFDFCLVMDYWIFMEETLLRYVLKETMRIAKNVCIIGKIFDGEKIVFQADSAKIKGLYNCVKEVNMKIESVGSNSKSYEYFFLKY